MKKILMALMLAFVALGVTGCKKVPAGHVGVLFNLYGSDKGVQAQEKGPGRYWLTPNEEMYIFPTFTQTYTWQGDETLVFQDKDSLQISTDVGITYRINPDKVTTVFQTYRKGLDEITSVYLRNMVRDAMVKRASVMKVEDLAGPKKAEFMELVQQDVKAETAPLGIIVEKLYLTGAIRLPASVRESIDAKIKATQFAQQRQNEVAAAQAEAEKAIAIAQGEAESKLLAAKAEAEAISIKGKALRENPALVELERVNAMKILFENCKGNGCQPVPTTVMGEGASVLMGLK